MKGANDTKIKKANSSQLDKKTVTPASKSSTGVAVVDNNNNTSEDINNNNNKLKSKMPSKLSSESNDLESVKANETLEGQEVNVSSSADENTSLPAGDKSADNEAKPVAEADKEDGKERESEEANGEAGDDEQTAQAKNDKKSTTMTTERGPNKFGQPRRSKFYPKFNSFGANPQFGSTVPPYYGPYSQYQAYGPTSSHDFPPLPYDKHKQPYFNQYNQAGYYFQGAQFPPYYAGSGYHGQYGVTGSRFYGAGNGSFNGPRRSYNGQQPYKSKFNKPHHGALDGQKPASGENTPVVPADQVNVAESNNPGENSTKTASSTTGSLNANGASHVNGNQQNQTGGSYPSSGNYYYKKERLASIQLMTSKTNIYIKGLDENTTDKDLYEMCQKFGEIKSTKAIIEKQNGKCKGYGFVDYKNPEDARKALEEMKKEHKDVQLAKQREQDPTNLYFANLPAEIDEKCLTEMLQNKFNASVSSTRIMRERSGISKGVGFARIDDNSVCDSIIKELNNRPFPDHSNKTKLLLVKLADSGSSLKPRTSLLRMPLNGAPLYIPTQSTALDNHSTTANPLSSNNTLKATQGAMPAYSYIDPATVNYNGFSLQMVDSQHGATSLVQQPHPYQSQSQSLPHSQISHNSANGGGYYHQMQQTYGSRQTGNHQYTNSAMPPVGTQVQGQSGQLGGLGQQQPAANQYHYQPYQQSYYSAASHMQQPHHQSPSANAGSYMVYPTTNGFQQGSGPSQLNGISQNPSENGAAGLENSSTTGQQAGTSPNGTNMSTSSTLNNTSNPMTSSLSSQFVPSAQFSAV